MKTNILKKICMNNSIALAYLFGSQAEAGLRSLKNHDVKPSDSLADLDVAVLFEQGLPAPNQVTKLYACLHNQLSDLFIPFSLDLVFLQEHHSVFQAQVIMGICIYAKDEVWKSDFEEDVLRRAADFKPFLDKFFEERLEEIEL